jgi:hypothetical protein
VDELTAIAMICKILDQVSGVSARLRVLRYVEDGYSSVDAPEWSSEVVSSPTVASNSIAPGGMPGWGSP